MCLSSNKGHSEQKAYYHLWNSVSSVLLYFAFILRLKSQPFLRLSIDWGKGHLQEYLHNVTKPNLAGKENLQDGQPKKKKKPHPVRTDPSVMRCLDWSTLILASGASVLINLLWHAVAFASYLLGSEDFKWFCRLGSRPQGFLLKPTWTNVY